MLPLKLHLYLPCKHEVYPAKEMEQVLVSSWRSRKLQHIMYAMWGCSVLSKGVVVEEGSHKQLLDEGGVYQALVRRQMDRRPSSASLASMRRNESDASFRS